MENHVKIVMAAIDYIEGHLQENPDLEAVAAGVHYSRYHLHRMFTAAAGLTLQAYIQRRRLTEAARMLVFSDRPILEIALLAGYESQQAFSGCFRAMYKKPPHRYRAEKEFYPLLLRYRLNEHLPLAQKSESDWKRQIIPAASADIPAWMQLAALAADGFPHLDMEAYRQKLPDSIRQGRAWILKDAGVLIGAMIFHEITGSIDFLGVHPQCRRSGVAGAFCQKALWELALPSAIHTTTFRAGDKADTGHRQALKQLGFAEAELLVEFGYPTQRFILPKPSAEVPAHVS